MAILIAGLALFLGIHSVRIFADGWPQEQLGVTDWQVCQEIRQKIGWKLARDQGRCGVQFRHALF